MQHYTFSEEYLRRFPYLNTYPVRYTYKRLCDTCQKMVQCKSTVWQKDRKAIHRGACGHSWDISGNHLQPLKKWLDQETKFAA